jgi:hypothetical protein
MVHKLCKGKTIVIVKDRETGEVVVFNSIRAVIRDINSDRSGDWSDYNEKDWKDGLENFTQYDLVKVVKVR